MLCVLALAALSVVAAITDVARWEVRATTGVAGLPDAMAWLLRPAMQLGNTVVAAVVGALVWWRFGSRPGGQTLLALAGGWLVAIVLKSAVARPRITASELGEPPREAVDGWAFPSAHTSIAWAVAVTVILVAQPPRWASSALVLVAGLTGLARLYVGAHFPLDVVGGALVGTVVALALHGALGDTPAPQEISSRSPA